MVSNQTECAMFEQRSVIKCLVAGKCKQCEIYRRMYDLYREACFSPKNVYKWAKHGLATTNRTEVCHKMFVGLEVQTM